MLKDDIKLFMGINNTGFDGLIQNFIDSAKEDMASQGIPSSLIVESDRLVSSALFSYTMAQLDTEHAPMYLDTYRIKLDQIRKNTEYVEVVI